MDGVVVSVKVHEFTWICVVRGVGMGWSGHGLVDGKR